MASKVQGPRSENEPTSSTPSDSGFRHVPAEISKKIVREKDSGAVCRLPSQSTNQLHSQVVYDAKNLGVHPKQKTMKWKVEDVDEDWQAENVNTMLNERRKVVQDAENLGVHPKQKTMKWKVEDVDEDWRAENVNAMLNESKKVVQDAENLRRHPKPETMQLKVEDFDEDWQAENVNTMLNDRPQVVQDAENLGVQPKSETVQLKVEDVEPASQSVELDAPMLKYVKPDRPMHPLTLPAAPSSEKSAHSRVTTAQESARRGSRRGTTASSSQDRSPAASTRTQSRPRKPFA